MSTSGFINEKCIHYFTKIIRIAMTSHSVQYIKFRPTFHTDIQYLKIYFHINYTDKFFKTGEDESGMKITISKLKRLLFP